MIRTRTKQEIFFARIHNNCWLWSRFYSLRVIASNDENNWWIFQKDESGQNTENFSICCCLEKAPTVRESLCRRSCGTIAAPPGSSRVQTLVALVSRVWVSVCVCVCLILTFFRSEQAVSEALFTRQNDYIIIKSPKAPSVLSILLTCVAAYRYRMKKDLLQTARILSEHGSVVSTHIFLAPTQNFRVCDTPRCCQ